MGKLSKFFLVVLVLVLSLWGAPNYMQQLKSYDQQIKSANSNELLHVFHALKGIYIQSIIGSDDPLKKETLERLIQTAKILKLDASTYESELRLLQKQIPKSPNVSMQEPSVKEKTSSIKSNVSLPALYKGKNVLHDVTSDKNGIVLEFGSSVESSRIKVFGLNSTNSYKKVIDIPAILLQNPLSPPLPSSITNLRISQYNGELLRVVLDAPKPLDIYVSSVDKKVFLSFQKKPSPTHINPEISKHPAPQAPLAPLAKAPKSEPSRKPVRNKTIVIDPGHGGKDVGATGYKGRLEKDLVLNVALELGKVLKQRGYKVFYTRQKDVFINLRDRTKVANDKNADLFISLHANAAPNEAKKLTMKGLETFFLSPDRSERSKNVAALENQSDIEEMNFYSKETFLNVLNREKIVLSNKMAIDIQSSMLSSVRKKYQVDDGGVREAPFWVLVGAQMPSILLELGYISHPEESLRMFNPNYQKLLVEGISNGIDQYFTNNP